MFPTDFWPRRRVILLVTLVVLVALFAGTTVLVGRFDAVERRLGRQWFERGEQALAAGHPEQAVDAYRTALVYSRDNATYRFHLAQSLSAAGRLNEAHEYLIRLWEEQPGNARVALALARVAVARSDMADAERYYHDAIYGSWDTDTDERRQQVRLEMAGVQLSHGRREAAEATLTALAAQLADSSPLHARAAALLLEAGSPERAGREFVRALARDPKDGDALAGAANAAFAQGDYRAARDYAERAAAMRPNDAKLAELRDLSALVLDTDPFASRLSPAERRRRVRAAYEAAVARVESCAQQVGAAAAADLNGMAEQLTGEQHQASLEALRRDPDLLGSAMQLVFKAEDTAARVCPNPSGIDRALLLLAERNRKATP